MCIRDRIEAQQVFELEQALDQLYIKRDDVEGKTVIEMCIRDRPTSGASATGCARNMACPW